MSTSLKPWALFRAADLEPERMFCVDHCREGRIEQRTEQDQCYYIEAGDMHISIARAMMKDAPIIILDEATANVDPESEQELTSAIKALTREKTILMIAHRLKTVRHADNILVIDDGKIVQSGTHQQLMQQGGLYRRFVESRELAVGWKV